MSNVHASDRRAARVRARLRAVSRGGRLRISVTKTNRHIYIQLIDDVAGHTLASATTNCPLIRDLGSDIHTWCNIKSAGMLGQMLRDNLSKAGVDPSAIEVYFDRGAASYTGVIKAVADGLRAIGLRF